jgi:hypothetical protein
MKMTGSLYVKATLRQPERLRGARDRLGIGGVGERVDLARLRDVPVLTELARQVAAGGAEGEHRRARQEVVQRLLLDRIDAEAARAPVGREHDPIVLARTHEAEAALPFMQAARAGDRRRTGTRPSGSRCQCVVGTVDVTTHGSHRPRRWEGPADHVRGGSTAAIAA